MLKQSSLGEMSTGHFESLRNCAWDPPSPTQMRFNVWNRDTPLPHFAMSTR